MSTRVAAAALVVVIVCGSVGGCGWFDRFRRCEPAQVRAAAAVLDEHERGFWVGVVPGATGNGDRIESVVPGGMPALLVGADEDIGDFRIPRGATAGTEVMVVARCGGGLPKDTGPRDLHLIDVERGEHVQQTSDVDPHVFGVWRSDGAAYLHTNEELNDGRTLVIGELVAGDWSQRDIARDLDRAVVVGWVESLDGVGAEAGVAIVQVAASSGGAAEEIRWIDVETGALLRSDRGRALGVDADGRVVRAVPDGHVDLVGFEADETVAIAAPGAADVSSPSWPSIDDAVMDPSGRRLVVDTVEGLFLVELRAERATVVAVDLPADADLVDWPRSDGLVVSVGDAMVVADLAGGPTEALPFDPDRGVAWVDPAGG